MGCCTGAGGWRCWAFPTPPVRRRIFLKSIGCAVTYHDRPRSCTISGGSAVESITCDGVSEAVDGVFLLRPTMAPTDLFPGLAVEGGYVTVDRRMATNLPGLFAAGDCTGGPCKWPRRWGRVSSPGRAPRLSRQNWNAKNNKNKRSFEQWQ